MTNDNRSFVHASLACFLFVASLCLLILTFRVVRFLDTTEAHVAAVQDSLVITQRQLLENVTMLRIEAVAETDVARRDLMLRVDAALATVDKVQDDVDVITGSVAGVTGTLTPAIAGAMSEVAIAVDKTQADLRDLKEDVHDQWLGPKSMGYSRFLATTGEFNRTLDATRLTMNSVAENTPAIAANIAEITDDAQRLTGATADWLAPKTPPKPKHWYSKIFSPTVLVTAGRILKPF